MTEKTIKDLSQDDCRYLLFEEAFDFTNDYDNPRFVKVQEISDDSGRWSSYHTLVVKDDKLNKYYQTHFSKGLTEMQDERPFEYTEPDWEEVEKVVRIVEVIEYVRKENK